MSILWECFDKTEMHFLFPYFLGYILTNVTQMWARVSCVSGYLGVSMEPKNWGYVDTDLDLGTDMGIIN